MSLKKIIMLVILSITCFSCTNLGISIYTYGKNVHIGTNTSTGIILGKLQESKNKMYKNITEKFNSDDVIISAVLLRDFLYSL